MATEKTQAPVETNAAETAIDSGASNASGALNVLLDTDKVRAIRAALGDRTAFESDETATAFEKAAKHLDSAAGKTENFYGLHLATGTGIESAARIVIATVGVRDKGDSKANPPIPARNGYKAIVVMKQPAVAEFLADDSDAARTFVSKLIEREATDVAFSGIRGADSISELETVMAGLPDTVAGIVENARQGSEAGASSFDIMWQDFRRGFIKVKYPALAAALPQKPDIVKAIKSKSYALANPATKPIEENNLFVKIAEAMIKAAANGLKNEDGSVEILDTSDMAAWLEERESVNIEFKVPEIKASDLAGFDF